MLRLCCMCLTVLRSVNMSEKGKKNKNAGKNDKKGEKQKKPDVSKPSQKNDKPPVKTIPKDNNLNKNVVPPPALPSDNVDPNPSQRGKYSRRKIESNWSRLELPENIYDKMEETFQGADLKELLKQPISIGDHFQFKHEKFWNFTSTPINSNENFILDLNKLTDHVLSTPFFQRNDLDPSLFTDEQLKHMERVAEMRKMSLDLKTSDVKNASAIQDTTNLFSGDVEDDLHLQSYFNKTTEGPSKDVKTIHDDELDELLELKTNNLTIKNNLNVPSANLKNPVTNTEEHLEEWLDEFLGS